ncbi:MAG: alpha/beta fold hydrolase [Gammaproteobacteria bacterium]
MTTTSSILRKRTTRAVASPGRCTLITAILVAAIACPAPVDAADCVVLLHGLWRTERSMRPLEDALTARGYRVANVAYPSREEPIERLAGRAVGEGLARCSETASGRIHFVAHSLGGILVRYYLAAHEIPRLGRIVMLAPPNHGSEVIDHLRTLPGVATMLGPAGMALGTDPASIPARLGLLLALFQGLGGTSLGRVPSVSGGRLVGLPGIAGCGLGLVHRICGRACAARQRQYQQQNQAAR